MISTIRMIRVSTEMVSFLRMTDNFDTPCISTMFLERTNIRTDARTMKRKTNPVKVAPIDKNTPAANRKQAIRM